MRWKRKEDATDGGYDEGWWKSRSKIGMGSSPADEDSFVSGARFVLLIFLESQELPHKTPSTAVGNPSTYLGCLARS